MATSKKTIAAKAELTAVEKKVKAAPKKAAPKKAAPKKAAPKKKETTSKNEVVEKKAAPKKAATKVQLKLQFQIRYHTEFGQNIF